MKFFDSLRKILPRHRKSWLVSRCLTIPCSALLILVSAETGAQTVVEEVELPKPVVLQSGVPIPQLQDAARRAISTESLEQPQPADTKLREYQLGTTKVREIRVGRHLQRVEVISEFGSTYVVENDPPQQSETRRPHSGIRITTW